MAEEEKEKNSPLIKSEPEGEMKKGSGLPLCIGPGCTKEALPESVYCGTDCILQHAAATMKTLSVPKVSKNGRESQRKPASARSTAKVSHFSTNNNWGEKTPGPIFQLT